MRKTMLLLAILVVNSSAHSQWRKIADFIGTDGDLFTGGEDITCIYFLDLPGAPRIGFVGTESELHKTTDGGISWHSVWDSGWSFDRYYPSDICFKDSLIGWFSVINGGGITGDECYRTTDGGETWKKLNVPGVYYSEGEGISYSSASGRLFLISDTLIRVSTDLGATWIDSLPYYAFFTISFSSPLNGIAAATFYPDTTSGYIITSDGGVTWDTTHHNRGGYAFAISGTLTCFASDGYDSIWRSDDFGRTWLQVGHLPPPHKFSDGATEYYTGIIRGDFSRLYVQSDFQMYVSTDSGVTWEGDGGPPYHTNFTYDRFYAAKGVTFAGMNGDTGFGLEGLGLWEEVWPQSGVAEQKLPSNALRIFPNPASGRITIEAAWGPVTIIDPLGRRYSVPVRGSTLDITSLPAGVYFVSDGVGRTKFIKE